MSDRVLFSVGGASMFLVLVALAMFCRSKDGEFRGNGASEMGLRAPPDRPSSIRGGPRARLGALGDHRAGFSLGISPPVIRLIRGPNQASRRRDQHLRAQMDLRRALPMTGVWYSWEPCHDETLIGWKPHRLG